MTRPSESRVFAATSTVSPSRHSVRATVSPALWVPIALRIESGVVDGLAVDGEHLVAGLEQRSGRRVLGHLADDRVGGHLLAGGLDRHRDRLLLGVDHLRGALLLHLLVGDPLGEVELLVDDLLAGVEGALEHVPDGDPVAGTTRDPHGREVQGALGGVGPRPGDGDEVLAGSWPRVLVIGPGFITT